MKSFPIFEDFFLLHRPNFFRFSKKKSSSRSTAEKLLIDFVGMNSHCEKDIVYLVRLAPFPPPPKTHWKNWFQLAILYYIFWESYTYLLFFYRNYRPEKNGAYLGYPINMEKFHLQPNLPIPRIPRIRRAAKIKLSGEIFRFSSRTLGRFHRRNFPLVENARKKRGICKKKKKKSLTLFTFFLR